MIQFELAQEGSSSYNEHMQVLALFNSPQQWLILIIVCLVIFGAKRLPEIARGVGRSLGEFKKARRDFEQELMAEEKKLEAPKPEATPAAEKKQDDEVSG